MNEKLQEALVNLIEKAIGLAEKGGDLFSEQVPDVVSQLLLWHGIKESIACFVGFILLSYSIYVVRCFCQIDLDTALSTRDEIILPVKGLTGGLTFFISIFLINLEWLKVWLTPKVWILEYAKGLM